MKKVAGKLKLSLANYRELAAFSQFASDLDESTQKVLERGKRLVEMLKQPVNAPIPFFKQVVLIYAGINGYLDKLMTGDIRKYEKELYNKLDTTHQALRDAIATEKKLTEQIEADIKQLVEWTAQEVAVDESLTRN